MNGAIVRVGAQAKLNLHLRVLAREDSGYHSLETIFHRIDLQDDVSIEITARERTLDVTGGETGPTESNLAWRAAAAYADHAGWPKGFRIELTKRIPVGAGLGGGSADAAAVLRALNSISPNPTSLSPDCSRSRRSSAPTFRFSRAIQSWRSHGDMASACFRSTRFRGRIFC